MILFTRKRPGPDVGVGPVEGAAVAPAAALPAYVDVVGVEEVPGDEFDAGVGLNVVHGLGDGQSVILAQVVTEHVRNLDQRSKKILNQVSEKYIFTGFMWSLKRSMRC